MRSIKTIAELSWRQFNPRPTDEVKNTLEEFIESAKDAYSGLVWETYMRTQTDSEKYLFESLLKPFTYDINYEDEIPTITLEVPIIDLPRDIGVYRVLPKAPGCKQMTKTTVTAQDIFDEDPGPKQYYRVAEKIYFPKGFDCGKPKSIIVTLCSAGAIDDNLMIPENYGDRIRERLNNIYGAVKAKPDVTNNQNPNV